MAAAQACPSRRSRSRWPRPVARTPMASMPAGVTRHVERAVLERPEALDLEAILPAGDCERGRETIHGVLER